MVGSRMEFVLCEENMVLIVLVIIVDVLAAYPDDMICQIGERRDNVQVQDELWWRHDPRPPWLIPTYWKKRRNGSVRQLEKDKFIAVGDIRILHGPRLFFLVEYLYPCRLHRLIHWTLRMRWSSP